MQSRAFPPLVEAFLIVDQPRQRLSHWANALAPLDDGRAPPLATITAYYDPDADQALIGLRYDELALGRDRLAFVIEIALLAEIGMIQPAELSDGDRRRFLGERLSRCTIHVNDQRSVVGALTELVKRARENRQAVPLTTRKTPPPASQASVLPRGDTANPIPLVNAKGTRNNIERERPIDPRAEPAEPRRLIDAPRGERSEREGEARRLIDAPRGERSEREGEARRLIDAPRGERSEREGEARRLIDAPRGEREARRLIDPRAEPVEPQRTSPNVVRRAPARDESMKRVTGSDPELQTVGPMQPPGIIYARYLRSGRWVPVRIGSLSLKGAALMSGALPREGDQVDVALSYADHRALVRGPVKKVSTPEETALTGAATFTVTFELDDASHRSLATLLTAARANQVTIKPPPPRGTRRYPVEWPVCLGTMRGAVRGDALDISREGMFVKPLHALTLDTSLNFSVILDDGGAPVSGRAKVVRHIHEAEARVSGLTPGYGLNIFEMPPLERERWNDFVARIAKRAEKRVLVGASPERLRELQAALVALGYAVTGGTDPGALVQLAGAAHPVDAVLLDGSWLAPSASAEWIESLFSARNVPCVTMTGDAKRGRAAIDKVLTVV